MTQMPLHTTGTVCGTVTAALKEHLSLADRTANLNGFTARNDEAALKDALALDSDPSLMERSLIRGWVGVVKENIHVAGLPNSAGTPSLRALVPGEDAPVVASIRRQGGIILGKANMHELALGMTSNNRVFGPVRNPYDEARSSAGSSGGTATVVASGAARFGLGTDTGGSVRVPASFTGLFGLRPTTGRYSGAGVTPLSPSRDTVGVMARTIEDLDAVDRAITEDGPCPPLPELEGLRLGVPASIDTAALDPEVRRVWDETLSTLSAAGVSLIRIDTAKLDQFDADWGMALVFAEAYPALENYLLQYAPEVSMEALLDGIAMPDVREALASNRPHTEHDRALTEQLARVARAKARAAAAALFEDAGLTAMIFPTAPIPAPLLDAEDTTLTLGGETVDSFPTLIRYTATGSFIGLPGTTFPAGTTNAGLPVGIALDGPENSDRALIALTAALTQLIKGS
jgi:Asp-tRNA(Asn)/Glu-tRNA(Gln) amidotransferase A subunit family amidase